MASPANTVLHRRASASRGTLHFTRGRIQEIGAFKSNCLKLALKHARIEPYVLALKFLIDLTNIFGLAAVIHFFDAAHDRQPFFQSETPPLPFIHQRQIGGQLLGEENRAISPFPKPVLTIAFANPSASCTGVTRSQSA